VNFKMNYSWHILFFLLVLVDVGRAGTIDDSSRGGRQEKNRMLQ